MPRGYLRFAAAGDILLAVLRRYGARDRPLFCKALIMTNSTRKTNSLRTSKIRRTLALRPTFEALESRLALATIFGLTANNELISFSSATPDIVSDPIAVTGLGANETLRGIDFRPRTGELFGSTVTTVSAANSIVNNYSIDPTTGAATFIGATPALAGAGDVDTGYDFNPNVDRIRYVNENDENARFNPNNGTLAGNDTDLTPAATTRIIGSAYDRNFDRQFLPPNAIPTTLYAINAFTNSLAIQGGINGAPSPNGGVITDLAPLGVTLDAAADGGFDIVAGPNDIDDGDLGAAFAALTVGGVTGLYSITLATAVTATPAAALVGTIGSGTTELVSIAIAPGLAECEVGTLNVPGTEGTAVVQADADIQTQGDNVLLVTGTARGDTIVIEPRPTNASQLRVKLNGKTIAIVDVSGVDRIVAFGLTGGDKIIVSATLALPATLFGNDGNDSLYGGGGADGLDGGNGADRLFGGANDDSLCGGNGNDFLYGQAGNDFAGGDAGNDKVYGEGGSDLLRGDDGNDHLYGGTGDDRAFGLAGNDQLFGEAGNDISVGGEGNDKLVGGSGRDLLIGGEGLDTLIGEGHDDILVAGSSAHDEDDAALRAILAEWTSVNDYPTRVDNIRFGGGANGGFVLDGTTVSDDFVKDTLTGNTGLDWLLFGDNDVLKDKAANELVN